MATIPSRAGLGGYIRIIGTGADAFSCKTLSRFPGGFCHDAWRAASIPRLSVDTKLEKNGGLVPFHVFELLQWMKFAALLAKSLQDVSQHDAASVGVCSAHSVSFEVGFAIAEVHAAFRNLTEVTAMCRSRLAACLLYIVQITSGENRS